LVQVDVKDKKGGQTPLYMAVKGGLVDVARWLIEKGADAEIKCYGKPISKLIEETMPSLDLSRLRDNSAPSSDDPLDRMKHLLEKAALIDNPEDPSRLVLLSEFRVLALQSDSKEMVNSC
jgi:hypothetical protein